MKMIPLFKVKDMEKAVGFYTGVLDFELSFPGEELNDFCVDLKRGEAELYLTVVDGTAGVAVCVRVDEVDGLFEKYLGRGLVPGDEKVSPVHAAPIDQTWGMREFYVTDPDGNTLRFQAPIRK